MTTIKTQFHDKHFAGPRAWASLVLASAIGLAALAGIASAEPEQSAFVAAELQVSAGKKTTLGLYVTAAEAYEKWKAAPDKVKVIDVRTPEEYAFVGHPENGAEHSLRIRDVPAQERHHRVRTEDESGLRRRGRESGREDRYAAAHVPFGGPQRHGGQHASEGRLQETPIPSLTESKGTR